ncbi:MAG: hypothetical protein Q7T44_00085 [Parvibaculum sp.]|nr:hypothetical protein [Parvibaculum sp.]
MSLPSGELDPILQSHPTINPYRQAAYLLAKRLQWDANPRAWLSRRKLRALARPPHDGKAVILCNGPSLNSVPFELLQETYTFGLNKINLLFDRVPDFRPKAIVAVNTHVISQNRDFYQSTDIPLFLSRAGSRWLGFRDNVHFLDPVSIPRFARDVSMSVYEGCTVTFVALQIAYHMGFRKVALVGADHNFAVKGPANMTVVAEGPDQSHFDPNYFAEGLKWQLPDLFQSEVAYTMARDVYQASGGEVLNATVGGKLEVFRRASLEEFLAS